MIATENQCKPRNNPSYSFTGSQPFTFDLPNVSPPIKMKTGNKVFDQNAWERIVLYSSYSYIIKLHYMYLESV